jgi:hypothetical protein
MYLSFIVIGKQMKLARVAYDSNNSVFWDCDPPSLIIKDVINDVSLFDLK